MILDNSIPILELRENNPYSNGSIYLFVEGDFLLDRTPIEYEQSITDKYVVIKDGEDLSKISFDNYGNSKWWWVIYDVNQLDDPFVLNTGDLLVIPELNRIKLSIS